MFHPDLIAAKSIIGANPFPATVRSRSYIERKGQLIDVTEYRGLRRLLLTGEPTFVFNQERKNLVFRQALNVRGRQVVTKLTMQFALDAAAPDVFLRAFWPRNDMVQATTGLLIPALSAHVRTAIADNLAFVDVSRVRYNVPIKNAGRHAQLAEVCRSKGLRLYHDELVIQLVH